MPKTKTITYADLSEEIPLNQRPELLRPFLDIDTYSHKLLSANLSAEQFAWYWDGVVILRNFLPIDLIDRYCAAWIASGNGPGGWDYCTPYMDVPELRDIALHPPLMSLLKELIGHDMGLHLNLTGWVSTERNWHSDDVLNPPCVSGHYAAVWMALDDIHPDSGPFEWVPGSHFWPTLRRERVLANLTPEQAADHRWPKISEDFVSAACASEIVRRAAPVRRFDDAKRGDVLVWSGWTVHRGTEPRVPGMERRALINHYSSLDHRHDMPRRAQHAGGGWYFELPGKVGVR